MRTVEISRRRPDDAEIEPLARVSAEPGSPAQLEILDPQYREGLEMLMANGIFDEAGRQLYMADGEEFVDALPAFFHGSRFWAEEIDPDESSV